jgi:hypothetical protein
MKELLHPIAGVFAMLCIATFWISTLISELFLSVDAILEVKRAILYAMLVFIPAMVLTGLSGFSLAVDRQHPMIDRKKKRMPFIALNGLVFLLPSAIYLYSKAIVAEFDNIFYAVQLTELIAGAINFALMSLNLRDGLRLSGQLRRITE